MFASVFAAVAVRIVCACLALALLAYVAGDF